MKSVVVTIMIALPAIIVILPLAIYVYSVWIQKQTDARIRRAGGPRTLSEIKAAIGQRPYSLVSIPNESGKPEVWICLCDVGPCDILEVADQTRSQRDDVRKAVEGLFNEFQKKLETVESKMNLDFKGDRLHPVPFSGGTLDYLEDHIGFPAIRKIDLCLIN
ncbi:hypothetical protein CA54_38030 [Symmachiella macrocystis]|uniref:Uncharacterized protein n=1 Tax=Symmachiella macrocystis TaxID=2527985 RepID=A0A5C6BRQ8_9PLAN|nr:hypothetical protein CA54_38030 [Symmachiella macrocystis]